jgi:Cu(I)/Ag(I) efflux system protein CusF
MNRIASIVASLTLLALSLLPLYAAEMKDKNTAAQVHQGQGTVTRVDEKSNRIALAHGPIPSLKWSAMTMDFQVKDAAVLKGIAPGQKVEFDIVQTGPSQFVITRIAPAAKPQAGKVPKDNK